MNHSQRGQKRNSSRPSRQACQNAAVAGSIAGGGRNPTANSDLQYAPYRHTRRANARPGGQGCHDRTERTVHPRGFVSLESGYSSASCLASSRKQHGNLAAPPSPHTNSAIVEPGVCGQPTANAGQNQPSHQSSGRSCHGGNSTILSSLGPLSGRMRKYFTRPHVGGRRSPPAPARRRMRSCFVPPSCERWTNRARDPWKETRWQRTPTA